MREEDEDLQGTLEKVIKLAIERGVLKPNERKGVLGQSLLHPTDKRAFLRKLLERHGLTAEAALALETEALAPPPPPPPVKPIPKLHGPAAERRDPRPSGRVLKAKLPDLDAPREPTDKGEGKQGSIYRGGIPDLRGPAEPGP